MLDHVAPTASARVILRNPPRWFAAGGLVGPLAFIGGWATLEATRDGYSPVGDAISRLAESGSSTRPGMTVAFCIFGIAVPLYALVLRTWIPGPAWISAVATGLATLGVAAFPLGRSHSGDTQHAVAATVGYLTLAATPLLAAAPLSAMGLDRWSRWSAFAGIATAVCLAATAIGPDHGLLQRAGLGATDVWIMATAVHLLRSPAPQPS